jgi:hypothetical protein
VSRTVSINFREAFNAQQSGVVPIILLTITHADLVDPIRLSTDPTELISTSPRAYGTTSRGDEYVFIPMQIALPDEKEGAPPQTQILISNVNREVIELVRSITTPPKCKIEIVLHSDLDTVEIETPELDILDSNSVAGELTLGLALNSMAAEQYPVDSFDPSGFPAIFG